MKNVVYPKNYQAFCNELEKTPIVKTKKCGHPYGYKCCCSGGENDEKIFDLVDEMNFEKYEFGGWR